MIDKVLISETSVYFETTRRYIPKDYHLHLYFYFKLEIIFSPLLIISFASRDK
jgi:hypothetical protein